jgi:hypothetical protein
MFAENKNRHACPQKRPQLAPPLPMVSSSLSKQTHKRTYGLNRAGGPAYGSNAGDTSDQIPRTGQRFAKLQRPCVCACLFVGACVFAAPRHGRFSSPAVPSFILKEGAKETRALVHEQRLLVRREVYEYHHCSHDKPPQLKK